MLDRWFHAPAALTPRVALADGDDSRAIAAAVALAARGVVEPILVSQKPREIDGGSARIRVEDGGRDPLDRAMEMVAHGSADACVAGASRTTGDVLRSALRIVGATEQGGLVSSSFFFILPDGTTIGYADCAVVPDPTTEQLATIAIDTADVYEHLAGQEPRVAMLSFSTHGSAKHESATKMREATELIRKRAPHLAVDGELQFDAAYVADVAAAKAPGSAVAGRANVFIFPDLDAGNIAYKITERLGGARAFGPLLQGLKRPVHDLSRGCSVDDIVAVATIAGFQTTRPKENVT
ncbi:MAG: recombinase [Acidimicrobiia bacterium]|nr:recombinase [Acidimicrobiia bacterium]